MMRDMHVDAEISGDPYGILKLLDNRLGRDGNIIAVEDVVCIVELMEEAKMLVDRCMFVNILRATKNRTLLLKFMEEGGWDTLYKWLQEARLEVNKPLIIELLKLYKHLPITVTLLKQNNCAKDIRQLNKSDDDKIEELSKEIVTVWMSIVKENSTEITRQLDKTKLNSISSSAYSNSHSGKTSSGSKESHMKSSHSSSSSSSSHSSNGGGSRPTSSKSSSHSDSSTKSSNSTNSSTAVSSTTTQSSASSKDKSGTAHRAKTVKTLSSTMRSTGKDKTQGL